MKVAVVGSPATPRVQELASALRDRLLADGHEVGTPPQDARLILNLTGTDSPRAHWRREGVQQFGVSVVALPGTLHAATPQDVLARAYPVLLKTLSNAVVAVLDRGCALVTPELGVRTLAGFDGSGDAPAEAAAAARSVADAVLPLAGATFAIENALDEDLPAMLAQSPKVEELKDGGRRLAALGLLPSVVRMEDWLSPAEMKLLRAVFGIQQISYGNVSVREPSGGFWMSGRGADKARLQHVGRDVLLVASHDAASGLLRCRVPPGCGDARVSVDALEHALIYDAFPGVGAIVHAHAWIDGIASTRQNWPCGTAELAREVLDLVAAQPRPEEAEVGLRNHGVTLTGPDVPSIFARVEGRLRREVPAA